MQHRMREFSMDRAAIEALLGRVSVGRISTVGPDGYPYTVAVHFVYLDGRLCFHGLPAGQKLEHIALSPKVCFEVDELEGLLVKDLPSPCSADTAYRSAVAQGDAVLVTDPEEKRRILAAIVEKYVPEHAACLLPPQRVAGTAVVEIVLKSLTGKYHG